MAANAKRKLKPHQAVSTAAELLVAANAKRRLKPHQAVSTAAELLVAANARKASEPYKVVAIESVEKCEPGNGFHYGGSLPGGLTRGS